MSIIDVKRDVMNSKAVMNSKNNNHSNKKLQAVLPHLREIVTAVTHAAEADTLEQVLERIAHVSRELVRARYAALGVPDGNGSLKYFKVSGLTPDEISRIDHLPTGRGLLGVILRERKVLRLERMSEDSRAVGFCAGHPEMTSLLGVPIQVGQQLFGTLYLCDRTDGLPFSEEDQWLVEAMAGYAALAITGSLLGEHKRRLALLEERERIGMELHDGVIQSLYAIGMHLELLRTTDNIQAADLDEIISDLNATIEDIRGYIMNLRASSKGQKTIHDSLHELITRLHIPQTLTMEIDAPRQQPPFAPTTFEAVCQIANEAISNALRHANASHISVKAHQDNNLFHITITDDGQGFDLESLNNQKGLGLRNIQQRARIHGGQVLIDTAPGQGTRLEITIPVGMYELSSTQN